VGGWLQQALLAVLWNVDVDVDVEVDRGATRAHLNPAY
jgi:hypothetical protein